MRPASRTIPLDGRVRAAWQEQITAARHTPGLLPALVCHRHELLPRFAAYYTQLRAFPRRVRRALQRQWRLSLAGIALLLALGQHPALAATISVSAGCSLVDAITAANTDAATGGCPAGSGADTIVLPAGSTQTLTEVNNSTYGPTGLPVISSVVTIAGQGSTIARDPEAPEFRLLAVGSTGDLTLQETTVSGGSVSKAPETYISFHGGGIANYGGTLTLTHSTITGNSASYGSGGGVRNSGTLTLTHSTIADNSAYSGGGVANDGGTLTLTHSIISGNSAASGSGGVANSSSYDSPGGTVTIINSIITGNSTSYGSGGGVMNSGVLTVTHSTITGNSASYGSGGGVRNSGTVTLTHSTIADNSADSGGGVANDGGTLTLTHSTITGNSAASGSGGVANSSSYDSPGGTVTIINSIITGNSTSYGSGGGVMNSFYSTLMVTHSTITGNSASYGSGGGVFNDGTGTVLNSTISGNSTRNGGGVMNSFYSTLMVTHSTIADNSAAYVGGGLTNDGGTLTVTNSTIADNSADRGGGVANDGGPLTVTNSTITGNAALSFGGGASNSYTGAFTLARTLVSGNTAAFGPEIFNYGTLSADDFNLFGFDGEAGVEGFAPGVTDVVPPAGVQFADILDPTLAFNGGPTQTHALVPGSPAIDAGGPICTDATGEPLAIDQRGRPRVVDGNGGGTAACDIGAFEFFPIVNDRVALAGDVDTAFDPTPVANGPAGTFTITATFTNTSATPLRFPFFSVSDLSGGNLVLNADGGPGGVGATVTPEVAGEVLAPGATVTAEFVIGLQVEEPFQFFVNVLGEPLP